MQAGFAIFNSPAMQSPLDNCLWVLSYKCTTPNNKDAIQTKPPSASQHLNIAFLNHMTCQTFTGPSITTCTHVVASIYTVCLWQSFSHTPILQRVRISTCTCEHTCMYKINIVCWFCTCMYAHMCILHVITFTCACTSTHKATLALVKDYTVVSLGERLGQI